MGELKVSKLSDIRPYDKNPRIIPQAAVDAVAKSIKAFGFRQPIAVDANGVILAGHTRYKAAVQLGLTEVPCVWHSDITAAQARGYRIADNKTAEISTWDRGALDDELRELLDTNIDISATGVEDWEIDRLVNDATGNLKPEIESLQIEDGKEKRVPFPARDKYDTQDGVSPCEIKAQHEHKSFKVSITLNSKYEYDIFMKKYHSDLKKDFDGRILVFESTI